MPKKYNIQVSEGTYQKIKKDLKPDETISEKIDRIIKIGEIFDSIKSGSPFITIPIPLQYILEVIYHYRNNGLSRVEAVDKVAKTNDIQAGSVIEKCTRNIGINLSGFDKLLSSNKKNIIKFLCNEYKDYKNQIKIFFKLEHLL